MPGPIDPTHVTGIKNALLAALQQLLDLPIDSIQVTHLLDPEMLVFTPMGRGSQLNLAPAYLRSDQAEAEQAWRLSQVMDYLYMSEAEITATQAELDLDLLPGYDLLSDDPLVWLVLKERRLEGVVAWRDMALISIALGQDQSDEIVQVQDTTALKRAQGAFSYCISPLEGSLELVEEVARAFGMQVLGSFSTCLFLQGGGERLLRGYLASIFEQRLPRVQLFAGWTKDLLPTGISLFKLFYLLHLAYLGLVESEPRYAAYLTELRIMPDMSWSLPAPDQATINLVLERLTELRPLLASLQVKACTAEMAANLKAQVPSSSRALYLSIGDIGCLVSQAPLPTEAAARDVPPLKPNDPIQQSLIQLPASPGVNVPGLVEVRAEPDQLEMVVSYEGQLIPLFLARDLDPSSLQSMCQERWRQGWFLSDWGYFTYQRTGRLSSYSLQRRLELESGLSQPQQLLALLRSS